MGHLRKGRFAAVLGAGLLMMGAETAVMAQTGLTANIALSNVIFTQTVGSIKGQEFDLFVDAEPMQNGNLGVSRLHISEAMIADLCMSAPIDLPGIGPKKFQMLVPGESTTASNLVIGAKDLAGEMTMINPHIGIDAQQLSDKALPGAFGLNAEKLEAINQTIHASSISADSLTARGGVITVEDVDNAQC
ncbi:DUF6230 family protein [Corynebacterium liangguodongii]|uniref:Uncharacterized protein n=1 Tax=Corynebacterium liangguodongii TaxID=2079535 RepID=A0A2S0WDN3_9CORY|nr:DUF6230 family protein [Corynebacterium liangguodongii]AWB83887.1 hypothetical protein C3E79_04845 [Corynebacterium liangguodongii]PWB99026.1 hypothetical protein DF219_08495 [Corynebacterium liangguodongii]